MNTPSIFLPKDDGQIESCFDAFSILRPHLSPELFLPQVRRQESQGYQIVAVMEEGQVSSVAGFRLCEFLAWSRILYIDDLSTQPSSRGKGYAGMLLDWLTDHAQQQGCNAIHLDTGYARHAAHRVYLSKGFELSSHHMAKTLTG